ncbi:hypothetical protein VPH35_037280 [Triticum aestivum]
MCVTVEELNKDEAGLCPRFDGVGARQVPFDVIVEPFHSGNAPANGSFQSHFLSSLSVFTFYPLLTSRDHLGACGLHRFHVGAPVAGVGLDPMMAKMLEPEPKRAPVARCSPTKKRKIVTHPRRKRAMMTMVTRRKEMTRRKTKKGPPQRNVTLRKKFGGFTGMGSEEGPQRGNFCRPGVAGARASARFFKDP